MQHCLSYFIVFNLNRKKIKYILLNSPYILSNFNISLTNVVLCLIIGTLIALALNVNTKNQPRVNELQPKLKYASIALLVF
jgi:hypothetical protein